MTDLLRALRRNRLALAGGIILCILTIVAIFGPLLTPSDPFLAKMPLRLRPPSCTNLFGTDSLGRDVLSRVIHGSRVSLKSGFLVVCISSVVGIFLGVAAGYSAKATDAILMRFVDFLLAFPSLLLAMLIVAILGPGLNNAILAVSVAYIGPVARLARGVTIKVKGYEFVEAARASGGGRCHIVLRHIMPNILSPLIVQIALNLGGAIVDIAGLSFLGLGARPPVPEWGAMLAGGRRYIRIAWWLTTFPGIAIMASVLACVFIGDGVREILDPKYRS